MADARAATQHKRLDQNGFFPKELQFCGMKLAGNADSVADSEIRSSFQNWKAG